ncbi:GNAT family N-acetyltransferase [Bacillus pumilus]|uniref:GNAT family N-acetyltransferase n=1 Tax=Bacillus pumilus TaxID=1408 RepID=UPI0010BF287F|nr:GNAT family N-acetyltransferase [Bacillus pumilus]MCP1527539.1 GNAT superfamily N-acetyltransferase [Bacillus pumilus]MCY7436689.1 GNAT family N-acetyltransferase [Bacillus pumilus]MCY7502947.1 GNAT family N-acetyltransferase [Bacillus pumilus]MCY7528256.1 GNAT family N-acetyltransferase [Bacillus pumilus]MDF9786704.1 GNAT superfamily N-acetyltransferase [Bacillus pumilus]
MGYTFRLATEADIEALLELTIRAYEPIRELGIQFQAAHADFALVQKNVQKNLCYVMEENGELLSTLSLRMPWGEQPGPFGVPHIWWFASEPSAKKGTGSVLLEWVETEVLRDTLKVPYVSLGTADKHPWLIDMYERKGYVRAGEKDLGKGHITVYFKKQLRSDITQP